MKNLVKLLFRRKHIGIASAFCLGLGAISFNVNAQQWDGTGNLNDPLFRFGRTFVGTDNPPSPLADQQLLLVGNEISDQFNKNIGQWQSGVFGNFNDKDNWITIGRGPQVQSFLENIYGLRINSGLRSLNLFNDEINGQIRPFLQWSDNSASNQDAAQPFVIQSRIGTSGGTNVRSIMQLQGNGKVNIGGTILATATNSTPMLFVGNSTSGENKNIGQLESGTFRGNSNLDRWSELGIIGTSYGLRVKSNNSSASLFSSTSVSDFSRIEFNEFTLIPNENLARPFVIRSQVGPTGNQVGRDIIHFLANGRVGIGTPEPVGSRLDISDFTTNNLSTGATVSAQNISITKNVVADATVNGLNINARTTNNSTALVTTNSISRGVGSIASGSRNNIGITGVAGAANRIGLLNIGVEGASDISLQNGQINIGVSGIATQPGTATESSSVAIFGDAGGSAGTGQSDPNTTNSRAKWAGLFRGDLGYTGNLLTGSDRKLKKDIKSLNKASLEKINLLKPSSYFFNDTKDAKLLGLNPNEKQVGFIAQELKEHFPDLVHNSTFPIVEKKENGYGTNLVNFEGVNYMGLIPHLVQAIQEQQKMIDSLKVSLASVNSSNSPQGNVINNAKSLTKGLEIVGINPNPTSGITYAEFALAGAEYVQFTVMDLNGKILIEQSVQGNRVDFNMAGYNAGLYIASIYANGYVPFTRSFIVK